MSIHVLKNPEEYSACIQQFLSQYLLNNPLRQIVIGVSGGSMPHVLCPSLKLLSEEDKSRIRLFPVDERLVPEMDEENNVYGYLKQLPEDFSERFITIDQNALADSDLAASKFEESLRSLGTECTPNGFPVFDILFLGLGPDGHTCSLFPGHFLLQENSKWVAAIEDSPKLPSCRVTITLPVIESAKVVAFIATGSSKAEVLKEIFETKNQKYPPTLINSRRTGETKWFLDEDAAKQLSFTTL